MISDEVLKENASREKDPENFAIFLLTAQKLNIWEAGKTVAKIKKVPLVDVTTRLFTCSGFIADNLTESQKDQVCDLLQKLGVSHFVVKQKDVIQLPKLVIAESGAFDSSGFECTTSGETATYPWENILLVNAVRFETVSRRVKLRQTGQTGDEQVPLLTTALFGIPISQRPKSKKTKTEIVKEITHRLAIDVFVREPPGRFRLLGQTRPYEPPDERETAAELERFSALAQNIVQFATDTFIGDAVRALAEKSDLSKFTCKAKHKFDLLNFYLLNLARYLKV